MDTVKQQTVSFFFKHSNIEFVPRGERCLSTGIKHTAAAHNPQNNYHLNGRNFITLSVCEQDASRCERCKPLSHFPKGVPRRWKGADACVRSFVHHISFSDKKFVLDKKNMKSALIVAPSTHVCLSWSRCIQSCGLLQSLTVDSTVEWGRSFPESRLKGGVKKEPIQFWKRIR